MSDQERFLKYNYIKTSKAFDDILQQNELTKVILNFDDHNQKINANITYKEFNTVFEPLKSLIESITFDDLTLSSYIVAHFTRLHDDKTLHQRAEAKFKVKITDEVDI